MHPVFQLFLLGLSLVRFYVDLREDKQFFIDHPGAVPITTAQVLIRDAFRLLEKIVDKLLLKIQNVKAVFDAAIKVVLQPPKKKKKKKRKAQKACSIL
ncbi:hypothetical protein Golob_007281 [Gossypium lobatum]|uniref:Secreted protein n=1 Tax=Gossypium lobatum TaxID=34289 RepID=A0A7J8MBX5_9ROSI|nr:hypothetical protein [Gossypium lobatum]